MNSKLPVKLNQPVQQLDLSKVAEQINVLGPRSVMASEGMRLRAVEVQLSPKPEDGDVYPSPSGGGKLALQKNGLLKIASAKGIVWSSTESKMVSDAPPCEACVLAAAKLQRPPMCPHNVGFKAVGAWLDPAGQWETHYATRYWGWDEELREVRRFYKKQIADERITEDQYETKVADEFNKRFKDRFSLAETKAMLRVIRQVGVKAAYAPAELARGFLAIRVEPDMSVEEVRRRGMASAAEIFGTATASQPALPLPDFSKAIDLGPGDDGGDEDQGPPANESGERVDPDTGEVHGGEGQPTFDDIVPCFNCQGQLSAKELAFCLCERGRKQFGGKNLCYKCQRQQGSPA